MKKVHYRVVLDVFLHEDDDADGIDILKNAEFLPQISEDKVDVVDVITEIVQVTDAR